MPDLVLVRVREPEHIAKLANFASDVFREYFSTIYSAKKVECLVDCFLSTEALTCAIADDGFEYFFVDEGDEHIGFIGVQPCEDYLNLSLFYLKKEARGQGYGRALFENVVERVRKAGLPRIRLTCACENTASLSFYEHLGFKQVGTESTNIGGGFQLDGYVLEYRVS